MIKKDEIVKVGRIGKSVRRRGPQNRLLVTLPDIDLDSVVKGIPFVVDVDGIFTPFFVTDFEYLQSTVEGAQYEMEFEDVDADEATRFVGKDVFFRTADFQQYVGDESMLLADDDFVGYTVIADGNVVGKIAEINDSTANALFVVATPDGKEILIPVADEFVTDVDDDNRSITMTLPEGLINLND